jgi:hypothetical protein
MLLNKSFDYFEKMFDIVRAKADSKNRGSVFSREYIGCLINLSIGDLLEFVEKSKDNLAYCVLGYFIVKSGANLPEDLRKSIILSCDKLSDESKSFEPFKRDIISYKSGEMKDLPYLHSLYLFHI